MIHEVELFIFSVFGLHTTFDSSSSWSGGATLLENHLPAVTAILIPLFVVLNPKSCLSGGATFCINHLGVCVIV